MIHSVRTVGDTQRWGDRNRTTLVRLQASRLGKRSRSVEDVARRGGEKPAEEVANSSEEEADSPESWSSCRAASKREVCTSHRLDPEGETRDGHCDDHVRCDRGRGRGCRDVLRRQPSHNGHHLLVDEGVERLETSLQAVRRVTTLKRWVADGELMY
jgi:hypothetical protein